MLSRWSGLWTVAFAVSLAVGPGRIVAAERTPASRAAPLDLALVTLDSAQLPGEVTWISEGHLEATELLPNDAADETTRAVEQLPIVAAYASSYSGVPWSVSMTVVQFESAAAVEAGFDVLEDEGVSKPAGAELVDEPALGDVGQAPGEVTVGLITTDDGRERGLREATFRVDRLLIRLAITQRDGRTVDAGPVRATAAALAARAESVLGGEIPDGTDPTLREAILRPVHGDDFLDGYVTADDIFPNGLPASFGYAAGYLRSVGFSTDETLAPPLVTISLSRYTDRQSPTTLVAHADLVMPEFPNVRGLDLETFTGRPVAIFGFDTVFVSETGKASVRAYVAEGDLLVWVDAQGFRDESAALGVATTVLKRQLDCVAGVPHMCGGLDLERTIAPAATPISEP